MNSCMAMIAGLNVLLAGADCALRQPAPPKHEREHARARLITRTAAVPGQALQVGVTFDLDPRWHLYWDGDSDSGSPVRVDLILPEGYTAGAIQWPAPTRHALPGGLLDYVYFDRVTLIIPVDVPADATPGRSVEIRAKASWLVCEEVCTSGSAELSARVPVVSSADNAKPSPDADRFEEALARMPRPIEVAGDRVRLSWEGRRLRISARGAESLSFFAGRGSAKLSNPIRDGAANGETLTLELAPDNKPGSKLDGVIGVDRGAGSRPEFYTFSREIPGTG